MPRKRRAWRAREASFAPAAEGITVGLLGGQRLLRDATAGLLSAQDGLQVLGAFESAAHFLAVGAERPPAVLLIDCDGGRTEVFQRDIAMLSAAELSSKLGMLCRDLSEQVVRCAIEYRVGGVILKSYSAREVKAAIAYVATGRSVLPAGWQSVLALPASRPLGLSPRHRQILDLIAQGRSNQQIASDLGVSQNTIKFHIRALYARLGVHNRVEAAGRHAQIISDGR